MHNEATTSTGRPLPLEQSVQVITSSAKRTIVVTPHAMGGCKLGLEDVNGQKIADCLLRPQDRDALIVALADTQRWGATR